MNDRALICGQAYTFLELFPSLDGGEPVVLCADGRGGRCVCPEPLWRASAPPIVPAAPVHSHSSTQEKLACFLSMFRGREGLYARRYYSARTGKSGYTPACKNEWVPGLCDKKAQKCPVCPHREFLPLTAEAVKAHLMGQDPCCRDVVGIYPMLEDNTTWLLAVDFDEADWREDVAAFRTCCEAEGLAPAVERSRSGDGAHVWFFFSAPVQAADARKLGSGLLTRTMALRHELSFASYDRLFPSQDTVPKGGFGNLIALPFQGQAQKTGNTLFVDETFTPYADQWAFLSTLPKLTPEQLESRLLSVCGDGEMGLLADTGGEPTPWREKRTRRRLTRGDFPAQAALVLSNLIYVDKRGFSQPALNAVKRLAAFPNPEYRMKQSMRLPVYGLPRVLDCSWEGGACLGIPRGCRDALLDLLDAHSVPVITEDRRNAGREIDVSFTGTLRPEQEPAARALLAEDLGVLSATTAFGKTVIGAWLIGQRRRNTLILVQSSALLEQWKSSLERFLDIRETLPEMPRRRGRRKKVHLIGQLGSGKNTRGGIVDIAIMQSLFEGADKEVKPLVAEYGMVLVDECHHVAAFTFERVLRAVEAQYVYGLSATPVRKDGHHPIIFMQCGPVRYLVDAKSQAEKRPFSHFVIPRFTRTRLPNGSGIQDLYTGLVENENRSALIVADTQTLIQEGRTPILLTQRKEHAAYLASQLERTVQNVFLLVGSDRQRDKREKLAALQAVPQGEPVAVVATGKYIGEGFDAPRLDTLLLAMPISWKGTLAQYAGRLHRNYEGKREVRIYDYVDLHVPTLERMYHRRLKGYAELGYQVKFGERDCHVSRIYNGRAAAPFAQDLSDAAKDVLIVSPSLQKGRVSRLFPVFQALRASGVPVTVCTRAPETCEASRRAEIEGALAELKEAGVTVALRRDLHQRFAVIDESVVWYGSVDLLAFGRKDADALRFEDPDIAGELLEPYRGTEAAQMTIPER